MYKVKFYEGDYRERQLAANADNCMAYVEQHFNSAASSDANYSVVITGYNASQASKNWGRWYAKAVGDEFGILVKGDNGIKVGGYEGRGDFNLKFTNMPAIMLEPFFVSNPSMADLIKTEAVQERLAKVLTESIQRFFPRQGTIAFSVGHKGKTSSPNDLGAPVFGGGHEAEFAEKVLLRAQKLIESVGKEPEEREIKIVRNNEVLWKGSIDADADVRWDGQRGTLFIN